MRRMYFGMRRKKILFAFVATIFVMQAGSAFSKEGKDDWCNSCFTFSGEDQVSSSAFDMKFSNNCGVAINFHYWRAPGKDTTSERQDVLALLWQIFSGTGFPNHFFCELMGGRLLEGRP